MKLTKLGLGALLALSIGFSGSVFAANIQTQAQNITIKTPDVLAKTQYPHATEVTMDLKNTSNNEVTLVAATSPSAEKVQLHKFIVNNGNKEMVRIRAISIQPEHDKMLVKNGLHIMLMNLNKPLNQGESIPITLVFADGSHKMILAPVG